MQRVSKISFVLVALASCVLASDDYYDSYDWGRNQQPINFKCPGTGLFADPANCSAFYQCDSYEGFRPARVYRQQCAPGTTFSDELKVCVHPAMNEREDCSPDNGINAGFPEESHNSGHSEGRPVGAAQDNLSVSGNLEYLPPASHEENGPSDSNDVSPNYPGAVSSGLQPPLKPQGPSGNPGNQQFAGTTGSQSSGTPRRFKCPSVGHYAHPTDCHKFYHCQAVNNGQYIAHEKECNPPTAWNDAVKVCDWEYNVPLCSGQTAPETGSTGSDPVTSKPPAGSGPSENVEQVGSGEKLADHSVNCTETNAQPGSGICKEPGMFPDPTNCHRFYQCVERPNGFNIYYQDCAEGTIYDPAIKNCNWPSAIDPPRICDGTPEMQTTGKPTPITAATSKPPASAPTTTSPSEGSTTEKVSEATSTTKETPTPEEPTKESESTSSIPETTSAMSSTPSEASEATSEAGTTQTTTTSTEAESSTEGDAGTTQSTSTSTEAGSSTEGDAGTTQSTSTSTEAGSSTEGDAGTTQPSSTSTEADAGTTQPSSTIDSDSQVTEASSSTSEPGSTTEAASSTEGADSSTEVSTEGGSSTTEEVSTTAESETSSEASSSTTEVETTTASTDTSSTTEAATTSEEADTTTTDASTTMADASSSTTEESMSSSSTEAESSSPTTESSSESSTEASTETSSSTSTEQTGETSSETPSSSTVSPPGTVNCPVSSMNGEQVAFTCPTGFARHPKFCDSFYQCDMSESMEVKITIFNCPNSTVFDKDAMKCVSEDQTTTPCATNSNKTRVYREVSRTPTAAIEVSDKPLCPMEGHFPHKDGCNNTFFKCTRGSDGRLQGYLYKCPKDYIYWSISRRCERSSRFPVCNSINNKMRSNTWRNRVLETLPTEEVSLSSRKYRM